jgi:hypothetical protein
MIPHLRLERQLPSARDPEKFEEIAHRLDELMLVKPRTG